MMVEPTPYFQKAAMEARQALNQIADDLKADRFDQALRDTDYFTDTLVGAILFSIEETINNIKSRYNQRLRQYR